MTSNSAMQIASALTDAPDSRSAIDQILTQLGPLTEKGADLLVMFITPHYLPELEKIRDVLRLTFKPKVFLGITGQGVIGVGREIEAAPGIAVFAAHLPGATLLPVSFQAGQWATTLASTAALQQHIISGSASPPPLLETLRSLIILPDPFSSPMLKLLDVMDLAFPQASVIGGLASGVMEPAGNRMLLNDQILTEGAVGVAIFGGVHIQTVVSQGCRPIGHPMLITKAQRNVVMELSGKPALACVREMVGDLPDEERELVDQGGLLIGRVMNEYKERFGRGDFLVRALMGVDQDHGYLAIADPQIRVGQTVQFQVRDQKTAIEDFQMLLEGEALDASPRGAMLFSCNGRGTQLFDQPHTDAKLVEQMLGPIPLSGFFAAGELGPVGGRNFVHGQTACLALFRDEAPPK